MSATPLCCIIQNKNFIRPSAELFLPHEKGKMTVDKFVHRKFCRLRLTSGMMTHGRGLTALHNDADVIFCRSTSKEASAYFFCSKKTIHFLNIEGLNLWEKTIVGNHARSSLNCFPRTGKSLSLFHMTTTRCRGRWLKVLDTYDKAIDGTNKKYSSGTPAVQYNRVTAETGLISLHSYFDKLNNGLQTREDKYPCAPKGDLIRNHERIFSSSLEESREQTSTSMNVSNRQGLLEKSIDDEITPMIFAENSFQDSEPYDEASNFYLANLMASINIAVFLFEIASPVRNSDVEKLSLPLMYGGKINKLILDGEWWRLVTPMFLHSGFLHIVLGCWLLITFGPQVCRGYGPMTFFFIYLLGGISANLISFVHAPAITVCGTGPVFAVIGAWLVYEVQNKEAALKEDSQRMFLKAVLGTFLSFLICNFEQVDQWSNFGAAVSGVVYGFLTFPSALFSDTSAKNNQHEDISKFMRHAGPPKSAAIFSLFILVLCFLVFFVQPNLDLFEMDNFPIVEKAGPTKAID